MKWVEKSAAQIISELNDMLNAAEIVAYRRMCRACTGAHILLHARTYLLGQYQREYRTYERKRLNDAIKILRYLNEQCDNDYYRYMKEYEGCLL